MGEALKREEKYTLEEYLRLCETEEGRFEFYRGEVFNMAGGSKNHNLIAINLASFLNRNLPDQCTAFSNDVRTIAKANEHYVYPDVVATCHEADLAGEDKYNLRFPFLIAEVSSESTAAYDQGTKKHNYFKMASLKYYLVVSQDAPTVELYSRDADGSWRVQVFEGLDAVVPIESHQLEIPLAEVYRKVRFEEEEKKEEGK